MSLSGLPMVICFIYSVLVLLKRKSSRIRKTLCSASTGLLYPEEDDGNNDVKGANDLGKVIHKWIPENTRKDTEKA